MTMIATIQAPEHSGKTSLIALTIDFWKSLGVEVVYQKIDPQLPEKMENLDEARKNVSGKRVILLEQQTAK